MNKAVFAAAFLLWGAAASGQRATEPPGTTRLGPSTDPNQIVCIRELRIGSRLDNPRVCRTRAEWIEHRRMYRENIERAQNQKPTSGG